MSHNFKKDRLYTKHELVSWFMFCMLLLFFSCGGNNSEPEVALIRFMQGSDKSYILNNQKADTLFCVDRPLSFQTEKVLVYVVDGSCSLCISEAIYCYRVFQRINNEEEFYFLIAPHYYDLLSYYLDRAEVSLESDRVIQSDRADQINKGVYLVRRNTVLGFMQWKWF